MNKKIRVRFPPSPTGNLHIGNARTALFNYLFCRHHEGTFVFRIEDTDFARSTEAFMQNEIDAMNWLQIHWDEGIQRGGEYAPYKQSERLPIYRQYIDQLLKEGKAYRCFCSSEQIEQDRNETVEGAMVGKYSGRCRHLSRQETESNLERQVPFVIRYQLPENTQDIVIQDLIRGKMVFTSSNLDDFILVRSDGIPTYNFAVTIDDATMNITHVIRGEDHLFGNTPRQILLYRDLGFEIPAFAHLPMILGSDKTKLSKRHGAFAVTDYKEMGFLPDAIVNYMALLGWSPKSNEEVFSMEEMIERFDLSHVNVSPAVFDFEKLKWFNQQHMKRKSTAYLIELEAPFMKDRANVKKWAEEHQDSIEGVFESLRKHLVTLQDFPEYIEQFHQYEHLGFKEHREEIMDSLPLLEAFLAGLDTVPNWNTEEISHYIQSTGQELQIKGKNLYHPLRIAITNEEQGPDLPVIIVVMGKQAVKNRLHRWCEIIRSTKYTAEGEKDGN